MVVCTRVCVCVRGSASAHRALRSIPSGGPIDLFLVPVNAPRPV